MIYFIQSADGPIKIGFSENPRARMEELQPATPRRLRLVGCEHGDRFLEHRVQDMFRHLQTDGGREWFEPAEELLGYIAEATQHDLPRDLRQAWHESPEEAIDAIVCFWAYQEKMNDWWMKKWGCQLGLWADVRPIWMRSCDGDLRQSWGRKPNEQF